MPRSHLQQRSPRRGPTHSPKTSAADTAAAEERLLLPTAAAYEALLREIEAVADDELTVVNIDLMAAVTTVTGVLPELRRLRAEIAMNLPSFNLEQFDKLEQYTLALTHAHTLYRRSFTPKEGLAELAAELSEVRDDLLSNAVSLARLRLIDGQQLSSVKTIPGYRALASDLLALCSAFTEDWAKLEGKTPFTQADLHEIGTRALELLDTVGLREQAPVTAAEATVLRQKAFTLFLRAYEQARRAVHYLRADEDDGERIAPSLYVRRGRRRTRASEVPEAIEPPEGAEDDDGMNDDETRNDEKAVKPPAPGTRKPAAAAPSAPVPFTISNPDGFPIEGGPFSSN